MAPVLWVLVLGWSIIEGLGAALALPALAALVGGAYQGRDRAVAYGVIGGLAGAGIAVGPLLGGWLTTYATWRLAAAVVADPAVDGARAAAQAADAETAEAVPAGADFLSRELFNELSRVYSDFTTGGHSLIHDLDSGGWGHGGHDTGGSYDDGGSAGGSGGD